MAQRNDIDQALATQMILDSVINHYCFDIFREFVQKLSPDSSCHCLCFVRALEVESCCSLSAVMHKYRRQWKINECVSFKLIFLSNMSNNMPMSEPCLTQTTPPLTTPPYIPQANVSYNSIFFFLKPLWTVASYESFLFRNDSGCIN